MRAVDPIATGFATNPADGTRIAYEVFGDADAVRTLLFLPTWSLVHSRCWKMQVPYFAGQGFRVVAFDGRGNGKSARPASGYTTDHFARDTVAVMDALGIERAALIGWSAGSRWGMQIAAEHPDRVTHLALIGPAARLDGSPRQNLEAFLAAPPNFEGRNKYNAVYWRTDYPDFVDWFFRNIDTAGEVGIGHAAINVAYGERRVLARGMSANHSPRRKKLSAIAVNRCPRRAFAKPM